MAEQNTHNPEQKNVILSKAEEFLNKNNRISYIILGIILIFSAYYAYQHYYITPLEKEAQIQIYPVQTYFAQDSFELVLNGDGNNLGALDIISEYGGTKVANLSQYYAGISYLNMGEYENAINYLNKFSTSDYLLKSISIGAIGDAYMNLDEPEKALKNFKKAIQTNPNELTTPIYLLKAGNASEEVGNYKQALEYYQQLKNNYQNSIQAREIEKDIARVEQYTN